jgi:hypothetical protein
MAKKKIGDFVIVKVTGPDCKLGDRLILPGETANVPADIAAEWIQDERATAVVAEVKNDGW